MDVRENEYAAIDSLYRISSLVSNTDDPNEALDYILQEIINVLHPSSASISLINPDSKRLELEVSRGLPEGWGDMDLELGQGITGWAALHGRPIIVPDVRMEPRYISIRPQIRSEMAVPMEDRGVIIGVVNVDSEVVDAFDEQALKILTLLTNEAARVVSRLWLIKQLRSKAHQLESLVNMGRRLVGELDLNEVFDGLAREGRRLLDCHSCALFLLTPDKKQLSLHTMIGRSGRIEAVECFNLEDSAVGSAIHRHKQVEVTNLSFTEENTFSRIIQREGLASMLASPIIFNDEVIGVLNAYTRRSHRFNNDEKKVFGTLAGLGAIAIQNARLYSRIFSTEESMRRNDKLTTLGMLAAEIAHEIRNPLTVIKLLFDSLDLQFPHDDARQTDITVIVEKLDQLEEIVERVLSFGRNREGIHARYDLNRITEESLRLVRLKLHQQKIEVVFKPSPNGLFVEVNKGQIQQVLLNLILNATQAMPDGGKITITLSRDEDIASVSIRDNGPGIPGGIQDKIFDSFLTSRNDGTGLGLSISKRILRSHRGDIDLVESSPAGTEFRFWLNIE
ncbi:GAF domain-containing protein [Coraliomargarita parva]|uniref:GAF domain-containing protein n=1 Tax=Coraliomargarita parva TaxID=3014050 RepID=UPI0022B4B11B|nr:GAF domain-containing protein [Coraliomargarita parva]